MTKRKEKKCGNGEVSAGVNRSVSAISNRSVTVSGCRRIDEYSSCRIRLTLVDIVLTVTGRGLTVNTYCGEDMEIKGWISSVGFSEDGNEGGDTEPVRSEQTTVESDASRTARGAERKVGHGNSSDFVVESRAESDGGATRR